jgi:hypothetical protein
VDIFCTRQNSKLKKKRKKKMGEEKEKATSVGLGAMFEIEPNLEESSPSNNSSDEDFVFPCKKNRSVKS